MRKPLEISLIATYFCVAHLQMSKADNTKIEANLRNDAFRDRFCANQPVVKFDPAFCRTPVPFGRESRARLFCEQGNLPRQWGERIHSGEVATTRLENSKIRLFFANGIQNQANKVVLVIHVENPIFLECWELNIPEGRYCVARYSITLSQVNLPKVYVEHFLLGTYDIYQVFENIERCFVPYFTHELNK